MKTEKELMFEEWERCKNDFCYFYNNYTTTGKENPIPEELWKSFNSEIISPITFWNKGRKIIRKR